jgi:hypothetical protein
MMTHFEFWDLFRTTVEGRPSPASCVWENGTPIFCAIPIEKSSDPNLSLLAEMLRSEAPIPSEVRAWLADMMDPCATSDFQFKKLSKRGRGPKSIGHTANWPAAEYARVLMRQPKDPRKPEILEARKSAIGKAADEFKLKKSSIEKALSNLIDSEAAHNAIEQGHKAPKDKT